MTAADLWRSRSLLADPATFVQGVPHDEFARLRRETPVAWIEEPVLTRIGTNVIQTTRGSGYWAITRHAAVVAASKDPATFSSGVRGSFLTDPTSRQDLERTRQLLINMDDPAHRRTRQFVHTAFTAGHVRKLKDQIRAHADALVVAAVQKRAYDLVGELAAELPLLVLADILGVPHEDRGLMREWANNLVGFDDPEMSGGQIEVYKRTFSAAFEYALELAAAKRDRNDDDLVSKLVHQDLDTGRLTEREYCFLWLMIVVGGNETTRNLLSGAVLALCEWPDERDWLVAHPESMSLAVEELLRWVSPIMQFRRTTTCDTELDGQPIAGGDKVVLYYASANRDEDVFASADRLDLSRHPNRHVAFGVGPHFCLGAALARVEATALLEALLPHLSGLEVTGPVSRLQSNFMNGIKSMPVRFARRNGQNA